jgi:hypothetical protein
VTDSELYREKQRQCLVIAGGTTSKPTIRALHEMAAEFQARAEAAEASERAAGLDRPSPAE